VGVVECGDGVGVADRGEGLEADTRGIDGESIVCSIKAAAADCA
jgi:hypothetical protein